MATGTDVVGYANRSFTLGNNFPNGGPGQNNLY